MKVSFQYITILVIVVSAFSCTKDNYTPPGSYLTGHIVYKGEAIQVERNQVPFQLYQYGFGKIGSIDGSFAEDGSYSQVLFDGNYKFIVPNGQGPFMWKYTASGAPDSVAITLKGSQSLDLEVTPYYMVRNPQVTAADSTLSATFKIEKIITDSVNQKGIERVSLYINRTQFVSGGDNIAVTDLDGSAITDLNNISLSVKMPPKSSSQVTATSNYIFARIGVKIAGVEDMIFSPVQKVQF